MDEVTRQLLLVQDQDIRIASLNQIVTSVPVEKGKLQHEQQAADEKLTAAKHDVQNAQSRINNAESEIQALRQRILQLQTKSGDIKKNEEYRAVMTEIETVRQQIRGIEDRELELMEELEKVQAARATVQKEKDAVAARLKAALEDLDVRERNCAEQIAKIQTERAELMKVVPEDLFRLYERLTTQPFKHGGFRKGVVPVENGHCGFCHLKIPPDQQIKVRTSHAITCGTCGTLLYHVAAT